MKIVLETPRLVLREFTPDDTEMIFALCTNKHVLTYTHHKPMKNIQQASDWINKIIKRQYTKHGYGLWAVHLKKNGIFLGWAGLIPINGNESELDIRFHKKFWNKGFGTEAAKTILEFAENQELTQIYATLAKEHEAGIALAQKLQMKLLEPQENGLKYGVSLNQ